jgi:ABC-type glycerol-3-phosphate transport system substrate-binding protein
MTLLNNVRYSAEINEQRQLYAWKFMKYLTGAEVNGDLCISSEQGYVPVRNSAYETNDFLDYLDDPDQPAIVKNTKVVKNDIDGHYIEQPYFPGSSTARDQVGAVVTAALTGNESVDTLFKNAVNQVKADMSE